MGNAQTDRINNKGYNSKNVAAFIGNFYVTNIIFQTASTCQAGEVVQWSAYLPSTPIIRVRILKKSVNLLLKGFSILIWS